VVFFHDGSVDRVLSDFFYDAQVQSFIAKENPLLDLVLYRGAKVFMTLIALALAGYAIAKIRQGHPALNYRHLALGVLGSILIPLVIATLKNQTGVECPWSLLQYGGTMPYLTIWESILSPESAGRCFPAGHAGGGFILFPWAVTYYFFDRRMSITLALAAIVLGGIMGLTRMAQGAHFFSHVLWAARVTLAITVLLSVVLIPPERRDAPTQ
jgi:membrane-associated PAP2 superfamily phosphatase